VLQWHEVALQLPKFTQCTAQHQQQAQQCVQSTYCGAWRRCACLDAKTRVLAVGALASTTCNNFIADLLFLSEVSHSLLVAGAPSCAHPYLGKSALPRAQGSSRRAAGLQGTAAGAAQAARLPVAAVGAAREVCIISLATGDWGHADFFFTAAHMRMGRRKRRRTRGPPLPAGSARPARSAYKARQCRSSIGHRRYVPLRRNMAFCRSSAICCVGGYGLGHT
jgi:hypothetical protein